MTKTSFIFVVNEIFVREPDDGGPEPRYTEESRDWLPPKEKGGFSEQKAGIIYRCKNGQITKANGYGWNPRPIATTADPVPYAGGFVVKDNGDGRFTPLVYYNSASMMFCGNFLKFMAARGDVTARDIVRMEDDWWPLMFDHHANYVSYLRTAGQHKQLAAPGHSEWLKSLLPKAYDYDVDNREGRAIPKSGGLAGDLPLIIGLVAFSCSPGKLDSVLREAKSWRGDRWIKHAFPRDRKSCPRLLAVIGIPRRLIKHLFGKKASRNVEGSSPYTSIPRTKRDRRRKHCRRLRTGRSSGHDDTLRAYRQRGDIQGGDNNNQQTSRSKVPLMLQHYPLWVVVLQLWAKVMSKWVDCRIHMANALGERIYIIGISGLL